uniref:Uncharacterized protein n=1 Tax=Rhizophagus irregularis (strain DAOM 181602 / DAOM 197198 / MUCL 43194) TaxID=747089 RepID=U9UEJ3_RHIID
MWLEFILEDNELKETLRNFVDEWLYTVDKEIIVNIGAVIQKGDELCLDGFLGMELIPKSSDIYKFNFDGILRFVKDERNVYIIALIIAIIILPCDIKTKIRTDLEIIDCLYKYSKIGSVRRDKDDKMVTQKAIQDVKVPAIKKELISCEQTIKEIEFKMNNLLVDEYSLRFCHSNGGNITIDWSASFRLINNENNNIEEVTNKEDAITRCCGTVKFGELAVTNARGAQLKQKRGNIFGYVWWQACKLKDQRKILNEIFDVYMQKIQRLIWNNRCSDTIDLEQQLGIIKELKRKNKRDDTSDEVIRKYNDRKYSI